MIKLQGFLTKIEQEGKRTGWDSNACWICRSSGRSEEGVWRIHREVVKRPPSTNPLLQQSRKAAKIWCADKWGPVCSQILKYLIWNIGCKIYVAEYLVGNQRFDQATNVKQFVRKYSDHERWSVQCTVCMPHCKWFLFKLQNVFV